MIQGNFLPDRDVSGYRFSDTVSPSKSDAPLGAAPRPLTRLTAHERYVSVGQEVPLNHEASDCNRMGAFRKMQGDQSVCVRNSFLRNHTDQARENPAPEGRLSLAPRFSAG